MNAPKNINGYNLYTTTPNTLDKGALYTKEICVNVPNVDKYRLVRVYLPSSYEFNNPSKRFGVMYMMDGKNLFDYHTSFVGEWEMDETIERYVDKGLDGFIVVGIDSAKSDDDRTCEMLPESEHYDTNWCGDNIKGYGSILAKYIFDVLKKDIDNTFYTLSDREHTSVGGSSMGGLYAFYMGCKYKDKVSFSLCFSPAFALYDKEHFAKELKAINNVDEYGKFAFFIGGDELENALEPLTNFTVDYLKGIGFGNKVEYYVNHSLCHNEIAWRQYVEKAINLWKRKL